MPFCRSSHLFAVLDNFLLVNLSVGASLWWVTVTRKRKVSLLEEFILFGTAYPTKQSKWGLFQSVKILPQNGSKNEMQIIWCDGHKVILLWYATWIYSINENVPYNFIILWVLMTHQLTFIPYGYVMMCYAILSQALEFSIIACLGSANGTEVVCSNLHNLQKFWSINQSNEWQYIISHSKLAVNTFLFLITHDLGTPF